MLNLLELEQLAAFAAEGTLSKAAEKLHISQPTITRTMQHLEEDFGVSLFRRTKNHIALNETGWKAVEYAERILKSAEEAVEGVRSFDRSLHTITVSSCAPAPLWELLPALTRTFPDMTISSSIKGNGAVLKDLQSGSAVLGVLPQDMVPQGYSSILLLKEDLYACLPATHALAGYKELSFAQLNGHNFLLGSQLGFWDDMCREKMPASRFLVQTDSFTLHELIRESALPCFATNLTIDDEGTFEGRKATPIIDQEAKRIFHLVFSPENKKYAVRSGWKSSD